MICAPLAHVAGLPIEETLGSFIPALLLAFGAVSATLRARLRRARSSARRDAHTQQGGARARSVPDESVPEPGAAASASKEQ